MRPGGAVSADGAPLGYDLRAGGQDVKASEWDHWLDFAEGRVAQRSIADVIDTESLQRVRQPCACDRPGRRRPKVDGRGAVF